MFCMSGKITDFHRRQPAGAKQVKIHSVLIRKHPITVPRPKKIKNNSQEMMFEPVMSITLVHPHQRCRYSDSPFAIISILRDPERDWKGGTVDP